jgi:hypothetical protein
MKYILPFTIAIFFFASRPQAQQITDFSGTWILDLGKSKIEDMTESFTGSKFIISQKGDRFKLTRYHFYGDKKNKISFSMKADGKQRGIKVLFRGKLEPTDKGLKATLSKKNFLNMVDYSFGSSHDELIADEVFKGLPRDHHSIWVFNRIKP